MSTYEFRISNTTSTSVVFYLEPWGGKYRLPPKAALRVVLESPTTPIVEWELAEDIHALIVHDPAEALATVYNGDREIHAE